MGYVNYDESAATTLTATNRSPRVALVLRSRESSLNHEHVQKKIFTWDINLSFYRKFDLLNVRFDVTIIWAKSVFVWILCEKKTFRRQQCEKAQKLIANIWIPGSLLKRIFGQWTQMISDIFTHFFRILQHHAKASFLDRFQIWILFSTKIDVGCYLAVRFVFVFPLNRIRHEVVAEYVSSYTVLMYIMSILWHSIHLLYIWHSWL